MKKCTACQAVQKDDCKFCSECGSTSFEPVAASAKKVPVALLAGIAAVVVIVIVALCLLTNPVDRFMNSLQDGDYATASELYYDKISTNPSKYEKTYQETSQYLDTLMEQFRNEEVSYDVAIEKIDAIDMLGILGVPLDMQYYEVTAIHDTRAIYAEAEAAFKAGHYADAIDLYNRVLSAEYPVGENVQEKLTESMDLYREQIVAEVNACMENKDYESALFILDNAFYVLPYDQTFMDLQVACLDAQYRQMVDEKLAEARVYMDAKDFAAALNYLDLCIADYPDEADFQTERTACLKAFEEYVLEESLRLAREGNYQHALSLAESGLSWFESAQVTELAMIYRSYIPVILGEMEIFKNSSKGGSWASYTNEVNKYTEDNYGNTYKNSLSVGCGSLTYLVNFKYQTLSGTVAFPKGLKSDNARSSATLTILGDGEEIAKFADVTDSTKPEEFSLDVSAYEKVTLKWKCDGYNIWGDWGDFATIFDGLFIPIPLDLPSGQ